MRQSNRIISFTNFEFELLCDEVSEAELKFVVK
jgi:hypothetical protein